MKHYSYFAIVLVLVAVAVRELNADCTFVLNKHVPKSVIILKQQKNAEIVYPENANNSIEIRKGGKLIVSCGDKNFKRKFKKSTRQELTVICLHDDIVLVGNERIPFSSLECEGFPSSIVQKNREKCHHDNSLMKIGFDVRNQFINTIEVCYDQFSHNTIYTWYDSSTLKRGHQSGVKRPMFTDDHIYPFDVSSKYNPKYQRERIAELLKSKSLGDKYIQEKKGYFLSRGHLTPKADFVYGSEQSSTFHYINAAPQWQSFNGGNWEKLEDSVRTMIANSPYRFKVGTGTYGVMTLPDTNNEPKEIHLHQDENNNVLLRVPNLYWKLVYNVEKKEGNVIIGINNPHKEAVNMANSVICKNVCDKISWLPKFNPNFDQGYMYCCTMDEFSAKSGIDLKRIKESGEPYFGPSVKIKSISFKDDLS